MSLDELRIYNARNLKEYSVKLSPSFNIFYGCNGAGKTTVLESVYLLLRSRTFRSSKYKTFINHDSDSCTVFSRFTADMGNDFTLAISRSRNTVQPILKLNSDKVYSISTISSLVLLGLITPESFTLLDSGPSVRRKFIDWGVFHVEPGFIKYWRSYKKIISNRNSILRQLSLKYTRIENVPDRELESLNCWNPQLVKLNNTLDTLRFNQLKKIEPLFKNILERFSPDLAKGIELNYYRGWSRDLDYNDYLSVKLAEDFVAQKTRFGTHRSELRINIDHQLAKDVLSRGQKKIVILSLIISQFIFLSEQEDCTEHKLLLLDDIDSELDEHNLNILLGLISNIECQKLITTTNKTKFTMIKELDDSSDMFHVKQNENKQ